MLLYTRLAPPKVPKKRSRAGCVYCKEKKKKCDEKRPQCDRCVERDQPCVYEPIRPRQRRKRDSFTTNGSNTSAEADAAQDAIYDDDAQEGDEDVIKMEDDEDEAEEEIDMTAASESKPEARNGGEAWTGAFGIPTLGTAAAAAIASSMGQGDDFADPQGEIPGIVPAHVGYQGGTLDLPFIPRTLGTSSATAAQVAPISSMELPFISPLPVYTEEDDEQGAAAISIAPPTSAIHSPPTIIASRPRAATSSAGSLVRRNTSHLVPSAIVTSLAPSAPPTYMTSRVSSQRRTSYSHPPSIPPAHSPTLILPASGTFSEFSAHHHRRTLIDHFNNVLSHLIVLGEESANPFQQLVLPLARESAAVRNAIYALSSAHMECRGIQTGVGSSGEESSMYYHSRAIQGLARLIEQDGGGGEKRNELLAAIMLLVYYEVLVQKGRSNIVDGHLKGAMTIINNKDKPPDATGRFLERAFHFYDVIAALSFGTSPLSHVPPNTSLTPFPPLDLIGTSSPLSNIDTLLGMATTLWPVIHRLSTLTSLKRQLCQAEASSHSSKVSLLRSEVDTLAANIEAELKAWKPCPLGLNSDSSSPSTQARVRSIINNAFAYRHAALVHLDRVIRGRPRHDPYVQNNASIGLGYCGGVVASDGPMGALLWPLFVTSCELMGDDERGLAETVFRSVERRQGMLNIGRAWDIVREVWRRADTGEESAEGADLWRRVCADMGIAIVFG